MQTYLEIGEFCKLVHLNEDAVKGMMANGSLNFKEENGKIYIEANQGTFSVVPKGANEPITAMSLAGESFVEKTIGTILNLHEKVLDAKDETLETLKNENKFLKDALYSMQEIYEADRKSIELLNEQLLRAQDEVEFMKRKYKLMWGKAVEGYGESANSAGASASASLNSANLNSPNLNSVAKNSQNTANSVNLNANLAKNSQNSVNLTSNSQNSAAQSATTSQNASANLQKSVNVSANSASGTQSVNSQLNSQNSATQTPPKPNTAQTAQNTNTQAPTAPQKPTPNPINSQNGAVK